ncbi:O-antigen ligase family protein [[Clostridium] colinum]|uniref:O-antigen ligase family protein n=1 Tax=[Clostridium] colinum TaxID=36835 RepID=UPI002024F177|nr:O-antigen ligase family protein [[Clostridium] colinum]
MKKQTLISLIILFSLAGVLGAFLGVQKLIILLMVLAISGLVFADYQIIAYALCLYPFIDFILRSFAPSIASIWDELLFIAMFLIWGYKYLRYRDQEGFKQTPLDLLVILFLIAMIVVLILNSPDYKISLEGFRAVVQYILWYFVIIQLLKDTNGAKRLCLIFVIVVSLMAIHGVYQYIIGVEMPAGWVDSKEAGVRTRVFSILTSPNILGSLMTLALPLTLSFGAISKNNKTKALFYILALMMVACLIFTFSRGAWIGFGVAILAYVFLKDKRLLIPVIILGLLAIVLVPGIANRITYMLSPEYIESSLRGGRLVRWLTGLQILKGTPLFGVGLGHFGGAVAINNNLSYLVGTEMVETFYMDNYYLKTAVETGLFGLFAFVILMYQIIINSIRTIRITTDKISKELEIGIFAGLFGVIVHNFVENVFEVPMMTSCFWLLVAVLMHFWYINYNKNTVLTNKK